MPMIYKPLKNEKKTYYLFMDIFIFHNECIRLLSTYRKYAISSKIRNWRRYWTSSQITLSFVEILSVSAQVPLCGHATLAAATVIFREKANPGPVIAFSTRYSGTLTATLENTRIGKFSVSQLVHMVF